MSPLKFSSTINSDSTVSWLWCFRLRERKASSGQDHQPGEPAEEALGDACRSACEPSRPAGGACRSVPHHQKGLLGKSVWKRACHFLDLRKPQRETKTKEPSLFCSLADNLISSSSQTSGFLCVLKWSLKLSSPSTIHTYVGCINSTHLYYWFLVLGLGLVETLHSSSAL